MRQAHASCQCVASESAQFASVGHWKTTLDGGSPCDYAGLYAEGASCNPSTEAYVKLWFCVPTPAELLGNIVRIIFFVGGVVALFMLLFGAFEWVSSGGDDKKIQASQARLRSAVIGLIVMVATLTLVVLVEQVIFGGKICLGISCPLDLSSISIIQNTNGSGRSQCFDRNAPITPTTVASQSATLRTTQTKPTSQPLVSPTTATRRVVIITATPGGKPRSTNVPLPPHVTVLPYGSRIPTPRSVDLPGTGIGEGTVITEPPITQFWGNPTHLS